MKLDLVDPEGPHRPHRPLSGTNLGIFGWGSGIKRATSPSDLLIDEIPEEKVFLGVNPLKRAETTNSIFQRDMMV
jgi:hypothetical protein